MFNRNVLCLTIATPRNGPWEGHGYSVQPKCALPDRCDLGVKDFAVLSTGVQPKCALPDHCDGASIKYVGHRLSCLCLRAPLQLAGLPKRV